MQGKRILSIFAPVGGVPLLRTENIPLEPDPGHSGEGKHLQTRKPFYIGTTECSTRVSLRVPKVVTPGVHLHI